VDREAEMGIVRQRRDCCPQRGERGGDGRAILDKVACHRQALFGVPAAGDQMQPQIALGDSPRLADFPPVEPDEIGDLRVKATGVNLAGRYRPVEQRGDFVEILLDVRRLHNASPPKTSTLVNTHAGDACPTRITCEGSPLPQYGVPSTSTVAASPTRVKLRQKLAEMPR